MAKMDDILERLERLEAQNTALKGENLALSQRISEVNQHAPVPKGAAKEHQFLLRREEWEKFCNEPRPETEFFYIFVQGEGNASVQVFESRREYDARQQPIDFPSVRMPFTIPPTCIGADLKFIDPSKKWSVKWNDLALLDDIRVTEDDIKRYKLPADTQLKGGVYTIQEAIDAIRKKFVVDASLNFDEFKGGLVSGERFRVWVADKYREFHNKRENERKRLVRMSQLREDEIAAGAAAAAKANNLAEAGV